MLLIFTLNSLSVQRLALNNAEYFVEFHRYDVTRGNRMYEACRRA